MGKLIQAYAVVCVTIDAETGKGVAMEVTLPEEMPVDNMHELWDADAQERVTLDTDQALRLLCEADLMTHMAIAAFEDLTEAQKAVSRWDLNVGFSLDQKDSLNALNRTGETGVVLWRLEDDSILVISGDGVPLGAR